MVVADVVRVGNAATHEHGEPVGRSEGDDLVLSSDVDTGTERHVGPLHPAIAAVIGENGDRARRLVGRVVVDGGDQPTRSELDAARRAGRNPRSRVGVWLELGRQILSRRPRATVVTLTADKNLLVVAREEQVDRPGFAVGDRGRIANGVAGLEENLADVGPRRAVVV